MKTSFRHLFYMRFPLLGLVRDLHLVTNAHAERTKAMPESRSLRLSGIGFIRPYVCRTVIS